jgi:DNA modification methylase
MKQWDAGCIDMCVCSPPYWALRKYDAPDVDYNGWKGQLGLEPTFDLYLSHLCDIFDEVKRVLKPEGTLWVNIGDTYGGGGTGGHPDNKYKQAFGMRAVPYSPKSLCLIPFRFAIEMVNRGWILRNTIIWHKPNCMPSSAKDRFTVDFEYLFFFSKQKKYYFEQQFEENTIGTLERARYKQGTKVHSKRIGDDGHPDMYLTDIITNGRNKRCVWTIPTMPCSEAHFAVYPEKLIETPIKAGCPEFICKKCGKARKKIIEYGDKFTMDGLPHKSGQPHSCNKKEKGSGRYHLPSREITQKGYTDCGCNAGLEPGIVLDPFAGRGTTGIVAQKLGRQYVLIELGEYYAGLCRKNLAQKWIL